RRRATGFALRGRDRDARIAIQPGELHLRAGRDVNHGTGLAYRSARWDLRRPTAGCAFHFHAHRAAVEIEGEFVRTALDRVAGQLTAELDDGERKIFQSLAAPDDGINARRITGRLHVQAHGFTLS